MNEESVSIREFERWIKLDAQTKNKLSENLQNISNEIKETNTLLRNDIATTKQMIENHLYQYGLDQTKNSETFSSQAKRIEAVEDTLKERQGVYNIANAIKWALVIVTTGLLAALGKGLVGL